MYRNAVILGLSLTLCLGAVAQDGRKLDELISGLGGADEAVRVVARQLLPRYGAEAVPKLLPLVVRDEADIWWAAMRVLEDIINEVGVPGREAERIEVTAELMSLVAPDQPDAVKQRGLRLLPRAVPESYDVAPMAALLTAEPILREKARAALRETGTTQAAIALCNAVPAAEPAFQAALIDAIGRMQKTETLPTIIAALDSPDPSVRAAAARAVAWTGDPQYLPKLIALYQNADAITRWDAGDALIRHAHAMGKKGGQWQQTINAFTAYVDLFTDLVLRSGAIAGLGAYGDETIVPKVLAVLAEEKGRDFEPAALAAFDALRGVGEDKALLDAFPKVSTEMQISLLGIFGRKHNAEFLPLLDAQTKSEDASLKQAALEALVQSALPGAMDTLVAYAKECPADERPAASDRLKHMAEVFRHSGEKEAAGKAFLGIYGVAETDELRLYALDGLKQFPIPEAFDVIMNAIESDEFAQLPVGTLAGIAKAMFDAERPEDANKVIDALMPKVTTPEGVREALQYLGSVADFGVRLGLVNTWSLVGPFPMRFDEAFTKIAIGEPNIDRTATYSADDKTLTWITYETQHPWGLIDLMGLFGDGENLTAYAYTEVAVPEAVDAEVRCGSDDGIKVWVNGAAVHENNMDRGSDLDQDQAPVHLQAGVNSILVQVSQHAGGWNFCLRLTNTDGAPLPFDLVK